MEKAELIQDKKNINYFSAVNISMVSFQVQCEPCISKSGFPVISDKRIYRACVTVEDDSELNLVPNQTPSIMLQSWSLFHSGNAQPVDIPQCCTTAPQQHSDSGHKDSLVQSCSSDETCVSPHTPKDDVRNPSTA